MDVLASGTPEQHAVIKLFYPHHWERMNAVGVEGSLAHYSSAEAALAILQNQEIWLRNTTVMNDYTEVQHGLDALFAAYSSENGQAFQGAVNGVFDGLCKEVEDLFNGWQDALKFETYITCMSEHRPGEDKVGRLSMWRAYGSTTGVALVVKAAPFRSDSQVLKAYSTPVRYASSAGLEADFLQLSASFGASPQLLAGLGREAVKGHLFNMYKWAALAVKHPGFEEEREWRIAYTPKMGGSDVIESAVKVVRGVPQIVHKLPLRRFEGEDFSTDVRDILSHIIIGPSESGLALYDAFRQVLTDLGVEDAASKVVVSDIPVR
ncbi:DUF2971 domain-containing protein [Devosia sp. Root635]|uniref:DUF2971 domain-containing protein n=1 Tax=Devosia sp. Root635 TaxID=1736575 RepID=UPI0006F4DD77|nr:DUF2971 domain-containing protein [Devosia sp. Root635]KRA42049.1 hypothetical protein ASD80_10000 [Devosia sp. Root635]